MFKKTVKHALGKDIYLLGADEHGEKYWLESPSWDCGWYWGFGYIKTYTNNDNPERSRDIQSHQHAEDFMSKWFYSWNGSKPVLKYTTFSEEEGWELSELFAEFYFLKNAAENFKRGKCNIADTKIESWESPELADDINKNIIPRVTRRILDILTPEK